MKNNRSSYQKARKGWKPKQTSDRQLAMDIVASIKAYDEAGTVRAVADYTQRSEIVTMVESMMGR